MIPVFRACDADGPALTIISRIAGKVEELEIAILEVALSVCFCGIMFTALEENKLAIEAKIVVAATQEIPVAGGHRCFCRVEANIIAAEANFQKVVTLAPALDKQVA